MKILLSALAIVVLLAAMAPVVSLDATQTAMAMAPLEYVDAWLDGYHNYLHGKMLHDEIHTGIYNGGYSDGWNYGAAHNSITKNIKNHNIIVPKVKDIRYVDGWIDGFRAMRHELPRNVTGHTISYTMGFYAGYDAPDFGPPP